LAKCGSPRYDGWTHSTIHVVRRPTARHTGSRGALKTSNGQCDEQMGYNHPRCMICRSACGCASCRFTTGVSLRLRNTRPMRLRGHRYENGGCSMRLTLKILMYYDLPNHARYTKYSRSLVYSPSVLPVLQVSPPSSPSRHIRAGSRVVQVRRCHRKWSR
jgi:hypothetical protein